MFRGLIVVIGSVSAAVVVGLAWGARAEADVVTPATAVVLPGQDTIWSGVVIARNVPSPQPPPTELREFAGRLKRVFGYNQFELFGSASNPISDRTERWLVPSKSFWLGVNARRAVSKEARGGYLLSVQLFQDKRPLLDTEAKLAPGSPLFIRGPMYGSGQLIIVLQVQRGTHTVAGP